MGPAVDDCERVAGSPHFAGASRMPKCHDIVSNPIQYLRVTGDSITRVVFISDNDGPHRLASESLANSLEHDNC